MEKICKHCRASFRAIETRKRGVRFSHHITGGGKHFCSVKCRDAFRRVIRTGRNKTKSYKKEIRSCRMHLIRTRGANCEICQANFIGVEYVLDLHHIDGNPKNNAAENLAFICSNCHRRLHKGDAVYIQKVVLNTSSLQGVLL
jgi:hypothetical protein